MAQQIIEQTGTIETKDLSTSEKSEDSAHIAAQVTMALSTLDSRYKENVANYAQELHACTHKIETVRISLDLLLKEKEPHTRALSAVEKEVDHSLRMLAHFTEQWMQKTMVVSELEMELKRMEAFQEKETMFLHRREELKRLEHEIGDLELTLLKYELEKENLLLKMEPLDQKIRALQKSLGELESQKRYIEASHLHRITEITPEKQVMQPKIHAIGR